MRATDRNASRYCKPTTPPETHFDPMTKLPAPVRTEINRAANALAQRQFDVIRDALRAEVAEAQQRGLSTEQLIAIVRARLTHSREVSK